MKVKYAVALISLDGEVTGYLASDGLRPSIPNPDCLHKSWMSARRAAIEANLADGSFRIDKVLQAKGQGATRCANCGVYGHGSRECVNPPDLGGVA